MSHAASEESIDLTALGGPAIERALAAGTSCPPAWTWIDAALHGDPWESGEIDEVMDALGELAGPQGPLVMARTLDLLDRAVTGDPYVVRMAHEALTGVLRASIYLVALVLPYLSDRGHLDAVLGADPDGAPDVDAGPLQPRSVYRRLVAKLAEVVQEPMMQREAGALPVPPRIAFIQTTSMLEFLSEEAVHDGRGLRASGAGAD
jgi:hypothetical protein